MPTNFLAQTSVPLGGAGGGLKGVGPLGQSPLGNVLDLYSATFLFERALSVTIGVMTVSAGVWFIFQLFAGTVQWITSGGEKQAVQNAQKRIVNGIVGLFIVVVAYGLTMVISSIFGFDILYPGLNIRTKLVI